MLKINLDTCAGCGLCVSGCPQDAIEWENNTPRIDRDKCVLCMKCVDICPLNAFENVENEG
jgi:ferredoxin